MQYFTLTLLLIPAYCFHTSIGTPRCVYKLQLVNDNSKRDITEPYDNFLIPMTTFLLSKAVKNDTKPGEERKEAGERDSVRSVDAVLQNKLLPTN